MLTTSYDYSNSTKAGGPSISTIASDFGATIKAFLELHRFRHVDVVAHSMGGLVVRSWIAGLSNSPYSGEVRRLITLASPHYGVTVNDIAQWLNGNVIALKGGCSKIQSNELTMGSEFIGKLHDAWEQFQSTSPNRIPENNLLFVAGTSNCSSGNCKDGLVHVQSAVLPDATQIRYVPYQHIPSIFLGFYTPIAFIDAASRETHKTYVLIRELLRNGDVMPQCCGSGTLDYEPGFFHGQTTAEGFLFLRVVDQKTKVSINNLKSLDFTPSAQLPFGPDPKNMSKDGGAFIYFPLLPYRITVELNGGYPNVDVFLCAVQERRPTVPSVIEVPNKGTAPVIFGCK